MREGQWVKFQVGHQYIHALCVSEPRMFEGERCIRLHLRKSQHDFLTPVEGLEVSAPPFWAGEVLPSYWDDGSLGWEDEQVSWAWTHPRLEEAS